MTIFKVYRKDNSFIYFKVDTHNLQRAIRTLWNNYGDTVRYDLVLSRKAIA